jgi:SEC-C motif domain protein
MQCPCGSNRPHDQCCGLYISGKRAPPTAEALMRSRYTAYAQQRIDYIAKTFAPESRAEFDASAAKKWAAQAQWQGLKIVSIKGGQEGDESGSVEFIATYRQEGQTVEHRETSQFRKTDDGAWLFVHGDTQASRRPALRQSQALPLQMPQTAAPFAAKAGRNDPCPCGSGKKYKKCCGA